MLIKFPSDYPFKGPSLYFEIKKFFHGNVNPENGNIELWTYGIENWWSPALLVHGILAMISASFMDPDKESFKQNDMDGRGCSLFFIGVVRRRTPSVECRDFFYSMHVHFSQTSNGIRGRYPMDGDILGI